MKYPKYEDYEKMYKRFFQKGVDYLLDNAELKKEDVVLDVCGGNGRLTKELVKYCDDVSYLDQELDMIPWDLKELGVTIYHEDIESYVKHSQKKYNKVFCEQAINYWLLTVDIEQFSNMILPDGYFIFNTFSKKPPTSSLVKQYVIDHIHYLEVSYLLGNKVEHIQIREGYPPHFTEFDWISKERFEEILSPYFDIELMNNGNSSLYKCRRKKYE